MRRTLLGVLLLVGVGVAGLGQHFYAFYYDLSGGQDLSVNLMNVMPTTTFCQLRVYNLRGELLWSISDTLNGYEADYYVLSDYVPPGTNSWGVVTVESETLLVIGLEYLANGIVVSVDTIYKEVPVLEPETPYWTGAYYTQAEGTTTGVVIMNPWAAPTTVTVSIYNPTGRKLYQRQVTLGAHESAFIDLEAEVGTGGLIWGLVDVEMRGRAVVLALEYYGEILEIKNITDYYL